MNRQPSNYIPTSETVLHTAASTLVPSNPVRKALTIFNNDPTNFIKVYPLGEGAGMEDAHAAAYIPIPSGEGLDIVPAPINGVRCIADTATCTGITIWEG